MEGYAISHNHGTRKWFLWRRNSSSRKTMFHSHVGGRVVFIDRWVWSWGDHCLCHWGSWCLQAKQSIMCHDSSKKSILFKAVFSLSPLGGISNSRVSIGSVSCRCQGRLSLEGFESKQQLGLAKFVRKTQCLLLTSIRGHYITHLGGNQTNVIFRDFPHYDAILFFFFMSTILS